MVARFDITPSLYLKLRSHKNIVENLDEVDFLFIASDTVMKISLNPSIKFSWYIQNVRENSTILPIFCETIQLNVIEL